MSTEQSSLVRSPRIPRTSKANFSSTHSNLPSQLIPWGRFKPSRVTEAMMKKKNKAMTFRSSFRRFCITWDWCCRSFCLDMATGLKSLFRRVILLPACPVCLPLDQRVECPIEFDVDSITRYDWSGDVHIMHVSNMRADWTVKNDTFGRTPKPISWARNRENLVPLPKGGYLWPSDGAPREIIIPCWFLEVELIKLEKSQPSSSLDMLEDQNWTTQIEVFSFVGQNLLKEGQVSKLKSTT